jgi:predicted RNase H-like nuclease (RuvC/YqgF family)
MPTITKEVTPRIIAVKNIREVTHELTDHIHRMPEHSHMIAITTTIIEKKSVAFFIVLLC